MQNLHRILLAFVFAFGAMAQMAVADVLVFAASSLKAPLDQIAADFEHATGERIRVSYASSAVLARQIQAGAPADVFLSANRDWADVVGGDAVVFATNRIALVVGDLAQGATVTDQFLTADRIVLPFAAAVPLGIYAKQALEHAGIWDSVRPKLVEVDTASKAAQFMGAGVVRAGVLYLSDVRQQGFEYYKVLGATDHDPIEYLAVDVNANGFSKFLVTDRAQAILIQHGFGAQGDLP